MNRKWEKDTVEVAFFEVQLEGGEWHIWNTVERPRGEDWSPSFRQQIKPEIRIRIEKVENLSLEVLGTRFDADFKLIKTWIEHVRADHCIDDRSYNKDYERVQREIEAARAALRGQLSGSLSYYLLLAKRYDEEEKARAAEQEKQKALDEQNRPLYLGRTKTYVENLKMQMTHAIAKEKWELVHTLSLRLKKAAAEVVRLSSPIAPGFEPDPNSESEPESDGETSGESNAEG